MRFLEREQYLPRLSDRKTRESWLKEGGKDLCAVAREKTEKILREHQVEPLDPSMEKKMLMVIEEVKKREMKS
jgi:trimethylamine:corrinoid methyltransferase-like protein